MSVTSALETRNIVLEADVMQTWARYRQHTARRKEACGVIIGSTSNDQTEVWLEHATRPGRRDRRWRNGFHMKDPVHQRTVNKYHATSGGTSIYLGTWHTHPEPNPTPSGIDQKDWQRCQLLNPDRRLLFAIVGQVEIRLFEMAEGEVVVLETYVSEEA
jgi:[CysO sulfur-carrier protein]-S-L-cysteine hydrolase